MSSRTKIHARAAPSALAIAAFVLAAACTRDAEPTAAPAPAPAAPTTEIPWADADAIDLVIVTHALTVARRFGSTPQLAAALKVRVAPYEDHVKLDLAIEGVDDGVTPEGVRTAIPSGARFGATLGGALHATVQIAGGEVGLVNGDVFVAEGAVATVDGRVYRRAGGRWVAN